MVHIPLAAGPADPLAFVPATPRPRRDGWTAAAQTAFIAALAAGDSVGGACRRVGRSPKSAYALRRRHDAAGFAAAWDAAVAEIEAFAHGTAIERCLTGTRRPVVYRGRVIGERIVHDDRLLLAMLRRRPPRAVTAADPHAAFTAMLAAIENCEFDGTDETIS